MDLFNTIEAYRAERLAFDMSFIDRNMDFPSKVQKSLFNDQQTCMLMDKQIERENIIRYKIAISDPLRFAALLEIQNHIKKKAMQGKKKRVSEPAAVTKAKEKAKQAAMAELGLDSGMN